MANARIIDRPRPLGFLRDVPWLLAMLAAVGGAVAMRAWMSWRTPIPAGIDAGYYAVQARALLRGEPMPWSDMPLLFWIDAAVAKAAMLAKGWDIDTAVTWASRTVDCATEPLAAIAVFAGAWRWSGGRRGAIPAAAAGAVLATLSPSILRMVGDFEKQSLAMAFMAASWVALAWTLGTTDARRAWRGAAWTMAFLVLTALAHAGTFPAAMMGVTLAVTAWAVAGGVPRGRLVRVGALVLLACAAIVGGVWVLAPRKAEAFARAPAALFAQDGPRMGPGGMGSGGPRGPGGMIDGGPGGMEPRGPGGPGMPGGPGRPGGPGGGEMPVAGWASFIAAGTLVLAGTARRSRAATAGDDDAGRTGRADAAVAFGAGATAAFLACPFLGREYAMRLTLMAPLAFGLFVTYLLAVRRTWPQHPHAGLRLAIDWGGAAVAVGSLAWITFVGGARVPGMPVGGGPPAMQMVTEEGYAELRGWREELRARGTMVVAARHGLEFWAALALDCDARQGQLKAMDFDRYEHRYVLRERRMGGAGRFGPGEGGGQDPFAWMQPAAPVEEPRAVREAEARAGTAVPQPGSGRPDAGARRRRRAEGFDDGPPLGPRGPGMQGMPGPRGPAGVGGPMGPAVLPAGSRLVKEGEWFALWEVPASARDEVARTEEATARRREGQAPTRPGQPGTDRGTAGDGHAW